MIATLLTKLKLIFTPKAIGILFAKLLANAASDVAAEIFSKENQQKAYEFVKELNARKDLSGIQKAAVFNTKMFEFLYRTSKKVVSDSVLNCLRELAVNALKSERQKDT